MILGISRKSQTQNCKQIIEKVGVKKFNKKNKLHAKKNHEENKSYLKTRKKIISASKHRNEYYFSILISFLKSFPLQLAFEENE